MTVVSATGSIGAEDLHAAIVRLSDVTGVRIFPSEHLNTPLGVGRADNRFATKSSPYQVLFFAETFETAFLEALVRDRYVGVSGQKELPLKMRSLSAYAAISVPPDVELPFLDLRDNGCHHIRVSTDTVRSSDHLPGRELGARIYEHHQNDLAGIVFRSRHDSKSVYAVFSWATGRLSASDARGLIKDHPDLIQTMRDHRIVWRES